MPTPSSYTSILSRARRGAGARTLPIALAAVAALAGGCAGRQKAAEDAIMWPLPPEKPRVKHVRSFSGTSDFDHSIGRKILRGITGAKGVAIHNPAALALTPDEKALYVSCPSRGMVLRFDLESGRVSRTADVEGASPKHPFGLAVDGDGNLYVTDQQEKLVWVYSREGKFLRQIGKDMFDRPTGIAVDRRRRLVYVVDGSKVDRDRHRVEVFAPDGRHLRTMGSRGAEPGQFNFPSFAMVAPDGNLYVADTGNFRIQVFDADGNLVTILGRMGLGPGAFSKVKGLAFDALGDLHAVDSDPAIVQMFNASHRPLMAYGGLGGRPELLGSPSGIVIDSRNNIYVADYAYNYVKQYRLFDTTVEDTRSPGDAPATAPKGGPVGESPTGLGH